VNGVNYTTYTTFRSPITSDECEPVSNSYVGDTSTTTIDPAQKTTTNDHLPLIPDPDYDVSDNDIDSGQEEGRQERKKDRQFPH